MDTMFVLPRYHTNLHYALKALRQAGHRTHLVCAKGHDGASAITDTHTVVDQDHLTHRDAAALMRLPGGSRQC